MFHKTVPVISAALLAGGIVVAGAASAMAQQSPNLLFVHGVPGADLNPKQLPTFPVNVAIDGACVTAGPIQFGGKFGPLPLTAGSHVINVSPANTFSPCTNTGILAQTITLSAGNPKALVLAEKAGAVTSYLFDMTEATAVKLGQARTAIFHAASAAGLDVTLTQNGTGGVITFGNLVAGARQYGVVVPYAGYQLRVYPTGTTALAAGPAGVNPSNRSIACVFVVGSSASGTLGFTTIDIPAVY